MLKIDKERRSTVLISIIGSRYKIIKTLGKGATGEVFLAEDMIESDLRAVKILRAKSESDEYLREFFDREVEALKRLQHPNIVALHGHGFDEKFQLNYLVLDYVAGQNLDEYISGDTVTPEVAVHFLIQLLDALTYAHSKGIYHRDIKPSNILVDLSEDIKLADFGVSKVFTTLSKGLTVRNFVSIPYVAPEQLAQRPTGAKTDIYLAGTVLYKLLTGEDPETTTALETLVSESTIDDNIKPILLRMVAQNPDERFETSTQAKNALVTFINQYKKDNVIHYLAITNAVINKLEMNGFTRTNDVSDAIKFLEEELSGDVSINYHPQYDQYEIVGRQVKLACKQDQREGKHLVVTKLFVPSPLNLEKDRERGIILPYKWKFIKGYPPNDYEVNYLLDELTTLRNQMDAKKDLEISHKDMIGHWEKVLELQKRILTENQNSVAYKAKQVSDDGDYLELNIGNTEVEFLDDQFLMVSKKGYAGNVSAGYYQDIEKHGEDNFIIIGMTRDTNYDLIADSGEVMVDDRLIKSAVSRQEKAIKAVKYGETVNPNLGKLLLNPELAAISSEYMVIPRYFNGELDESKKEAVKNAVLAKDLYVIQGPPGTGKTTLISELVAQITNANSRAKILISSQSNVAVNHALIQISNLCSDLQMIRIGRREKMSLGAEDYIFEQRLKLFADKTRAQSNAFTMKYKERMNISADALEALTLLEEVKQNNTILQSLEEHLEVLNSELEDSMSIEKMVNQGSIEFTDLSSRLTKTAESIESESTLKSALETTFNEYIQAGEEFLNTINSNKDLINRYAELRKDIEGITQTIEKLSKDCIETCLLIGDVLNINLDDTELNRMIETIQEKTTDYKENAEKIAKVELIRKEWLKRVENVDELGEACVKEATVVAATCLGIASNQNVHNLEFDYVIIDEAGRATPPETLVPAVRGKKIIMVGDQKQLPPMVDHSLTNDLLGTINLTRDQLTHTIFEKLFMEVPEQVRCVLKGQYRMHPAIGQLISEAFYDSQLVSNTKHDEKSHNLRWWPKAVIWFSTSQKDNRFEEPVGKSRQNSCEARYIEELMADIEQQYRSLNLTKKIAIITGYLAQKSLLKTLIDVEDRNRWKALNIEVDTVDAFQGRETDIVIYSVVRSNNENNLGFIGDHRRLNVALSRAKELLVIVGDLDFVPGARVREGKNPFVPVAEYIKSNNGECLIEVIN